MRFSLRYCQTKLEQAVDMLDGEGDPRERVLAAARSNLVGLSEHLPPEDARERELWEKVQGIVGRLSTMPPAGDEGLLAAAAHLLPESEVEQLAADIRAAHALAREILE